ncbi:unnamed protein product [Timema podura]|uniref:Uncharacterized protein n=1 Tax=Timema podura TaxID=61482 RepID=A0ABN7PAV6_TIMPD|nr:unnamed protein product [Timema podura]
MYSVTLVPLPVSLSTRKYRGYLWWRRRYRNTPPCHTGLRRWWTCTAVKTSPPRPTSGLWAVYSTSCVSSLCHSERAHWRYRAVTSPSRTTPAIPRKYTASLGLCLNQILTNDPTSSKSVL